MSDEPGIIMSIFLDKASAPEIAGFIMRRVREQSTFWGIVPPYTGTDDFAGRMMTAPCNPPVMTPGIAGRMHISHVRFDSDQQREFRQRLRLVAIIPNTSNR